MATHHGADVLYQAALDTIGASGSIVTKSQTQAQTPPNVITDLTYALALQQQGESLSASKPVLSVTVGDFSYYGAVSTEGRSCIYVNGGSGDPTLLGANTGVFPST
jgi:hypothetical protein